MEQRAVLLLLNKPARFLVEDRGLIGPDNLLSLGLLPISVTLTPLCHLPMGTSVWIPWVPNTESEPRLSETILVLAHGTRKPRSRVSNDLRRDSDMIRILCLSVTVSVLYYFMLLPCVHRI